MSTGSAWGMIKTTYNEWSEDRASYLAAALAYYAIFAIAPLLIIAIVIIGVYYGEAAATGKVESQLQTYVGPQAADAISGLIVKAQENGAGASIIGLVILLWAASNLFVTLQDALNIIWDVEPKPGRGIMGMIKDRAFAFLLVLGVAALLLASIVASTLIPALQHYLPMPGWLAQTGNIVLSLLVFTGAFAVIYKYLPDVNITWRDVLVGAAVTAVGITVGKWLLGLYLAYSSTTSAYGTAGSLVGLLIFIYFSAQIVFLAAEFTQVYARRNGKAIRPADNAVRIGNKTDENLGRRREKKQQQQTRRAEDTPAPPPPPAPTPTDKEAARRAAERYAADAYNLPRVRQAARSGDTEQKPFVKRHKWALAGGGASLAALAGAGWWFARRKG